jgi:hypothetical protein
MDERIRGEMVELQLEFRRRGFYRAATARILLEWVYNFTLTFGGLVVWCLSDSWWLKGAGLLVSTLGLTGITTMWCTTRRQMSSGSTTTVICCPSSR